MTTEVRWEATIEDDDEFVAGTGRQQTILTGKWADSAENATIAVERALCYYLDSETWDSWFGLDCSSVTLRCRVYAPVAIAGDYLADVGRVTTAYVRKTASAVMDIPPHTTLK